MKNMKCSDQEFFKQCAAFFGSTIVAHAIFDAYCESHRKYHNLAHLKALFDEVDPFTDVFCQAHIDAIHIAIWFHDFVYKTDANYPNNEIDSARGMCKLLHSDAQDFCLTRKQSIDLATEMILATSGHKIPYNMVSPTECDACALFLDADLSILASKGAQLVDYDHSIASEWLGNRKPTEAFCTGRIGALENLASRPNIFYSKQFKSKELLARNNLKSLVGYWESMLDSINVDLVNVGRTMRCGDSVLA